MIHGSFYRFVHLFWLCDLAWKSSLLLIKICSIDQIFFMTFQFQGYKIRIFWSFWAILEFFDFLEPDFHGLIFGKIDIKGLELVIFLFNNIKLSFFANHGNQSFPLDTLEWKMRLFHLIFKHCEYLAYRSWKKNWN